MSEKRRECEERDSGGGVKLGDAAGALSGSAGMACRSGEGVEGEGRSGSKAGGSGIGGAGGARRLSGFRSPPESGEVDMCSHWRGAGSAGRRRSL